MCAKMLSSVTYEVLFKVRADTDLGDVVCMTGDCDELGNWDPDKAVKLRRQADNNVWSKQMKFTSTRETLKYRYFIAQLFQSEDHEEKSTIVTQWETNIQPRKISMHDFGKEEDTSSMATFGDYDNMHHVTRGWLIDQSQINIRFHGNPIKMWNTKYRNQTYSIKCTPIDHRYRDEHSDEEGEHLPQAGNTIVRVSVLEQGRSAPHMQTEYGAIYTPDCYMNFMIQTMDPENTGFQLDFYVHDCTEEEEKKTPPRHVGYAFILPLSIYCSVDSKTVPITSLHHKPLGQIKFEYLVVKPLVGHRFNMEVSYQNYWKKSRQPLDIGHRGMGTSFSGKNNLLANVPENTVQSLKDAADHGADFVEFDVHLTKDKEVIVYHDFKVKITCKKKQSGGLDLLETPVKDLTLSELREMKLWHKPRPENLEELHAEEATADDLETFPTLERCLDCVDKHTGFNIEIKFPQELKTGTHEQEGYYDMNLFIDAVLHVVFKHHGGRRIVFSTFDCNACIALRLKQNRYPVLFLTQADTTAYESYGDLRTRSVTMATEFCIAHGLLGVNPMSEVLLKDLSLIDYVKDSGLVLFTWGEDNNNVEVIDKLKQLRVDAIIYDRIDCFKTTGKESIFKMENRKKLEMLYNKMSTMDASGTKPS